MNTHAMLCSWCFKLHNREYSLAHCSKECCLETHQYLEVLRKRGKMRNKAYEERNDISEN